MQELKDKHAQLAAQVKERHAQIVVSLLERGQRYKLRVAYSMLTAACRQQIRQRKLVSRCVQRMAKRVLSGAFQGWALIAASAIEKRETTRRLMCVIGRGIDTILLRTVLNDWLECARRERAARTHLSMQSAFEKEKLCLQREAEEHASEATARSAALRIAKEVCTGLRAQRSEMSAEVERLQEQVQAQRAQVLLLESQFAREEHEAQCKAAVKIQTCVRRRQAVNVAVAKRAENKAAAAIQAVARGWRARAVYLAQRKATSIIQAAMQRSQAEDSEEEVVEAPAEGKESPVFHRDGRIFFRKQRSCPLLLGHVDQSPSPSPPPSPWPTESLYLGGAPSEVRNDFKKRIDVDQVAPRQPQAKASPSPICNRRYSFWQAVEAQVEDDDVHMQALESTLGRVGGSDDEDVHLEELKAVAAAEVCVRGAMDSMMGGADGLTAACSGREMAEAAVQQAGVSEDGQAVARVSRIVAKAVDRTVEFLMGECGDLVEMARGNPPSRVIHAVEIGVHVVISDLQVRHADPGACRSVEVLTQLKTILASGQQVAGEELERLQGEASFGLRPQALRDHEAVAVWVAVRRGVLTGLGLRRGDAAAGAALTAVSRWAETRAAASGAALACVRGQYATADTRLELAEEEVAATEVAMMQVSTSRMTSTSTSGGRVVVLSMNRAELLLLASRYFCASYTRAYYELRGKAEERVALSAAAALIQSKYRTHRSEDRQQQANAREFAVAIRRRNQARGEETRLRALNVVKIQARIRGKAARARFTAMKRARGGAVA